MTSFDYVLRETARTSLRVGMPRCRFLVAAINLMIDGPLAYQDPKTQNEYIHRLYFDNILPVEQATDMQIAQADGQAATQSTCGVTREAIERAAGVDNPALYRWYADRVNAGDFAVEQEKEFAESIGAWRSGIPWVEGTPLPGPGDAVIIGLASDGGFSRGDGFSGEHEFTVLFEKDGIVHSVDGGQPGIDLVVRAWSEVWTGTDDQGRRTGELWACKVNPDGSVSLDASGRPFQGRRVVGYEDCTQLPLRADATSCPVIPALPAPDADDVDVSLAVPASSSPIVSGARAVSKVLGGLVVVAGILFGGRYVYKKYVKKVSA